MIWMNGDSRTVLIVDDDPQVLRLVEQMLRPRNIRVLAAPRPTAALEIFARESVHLLISDVAMPEMDGGKLAERALSLQPETRILLISGYPKEPTVDARPGQVRFLRKPFFPSQLIENLGALLDE